MKPATQATDVAATATGGADEIVCGCADLTRDGIRASVASNPSASFDAFLDATGAGRTCTACMLDLEYLFTEAPRDRAAAAHIAAGEPDRPRPPSLKRRLYAALDSIPVMMPWNLTNCMPVLHGAGIEQFVWLANHPLLYDDGPGTREDFRIRIALRDHAGRRVHREWLTLAGGEAVRIGLSGHFDAGPELGIGSIALDRFAVRPTLRGTTRPQAEIVSARSAASLHFQAPGYNDSRSLRIPWQPEVERAMFSIVNAGRTSYRIGFSYSVNGSDPDEHLGGANCIVPPHGARLHEIRLDERAAARLDGRLLLVRWRARGHGKLHFLNLTRNGERLSIDHL